MTRYRGSTRRKHTLPRYRRYWSKSVRGAMQYFAPVWWMTLDEMLQRYPPRPGEPEVVALETYPKWVPAQNESISALTAERLTDAMRVMGKETLP